MSPFNPDPQNRYPSPRSDSGQSRDDERVIEAEIIHDGCDDGRGQGPYGRSCRGGYGQEQFRGSRSPWNGGLHFQTIWTSGSSRQAGLAPGITLALIIIAGIQFGLLASIGFMAFAGCADTRVFVPGSVTSIGNQALGYIGWSGVVEGFTIEGYTGSAAEVYATENGFAFVAVTDGAQ